MPETLNHNSDVRERMVSSEHQRLVNALALAWEGRGIRVTAVDMAGTPQYFEPRYRNLPKPAYSGGIPDLEGMDANGIVHLGEAETDMEAENLTRQLRNFSNLVMKHTNAPVPLHVIVPARLRPRLVDKMFQVGLSDRVSGGRIVIWSL